ncbi:uncharacterized protein LOC105843529 [Hydra vulgaris]|uniref:uncharacterized protein LOC105843529 n=1 Tax=Hydra vulgaris TaxID=6087 RepID=UPI001F5EFDB2|nr:uncharacterized protein LOC105843529 [Hydra vulgaris]XP_047135919.1 uncharacterized protein LOC105843529 [Hydra vulgaris]XP_047135920.1 uncharacterized protein LOC105843529 [Hydra vulgaris]XP_047135921.1 uncharacterized protein LOC105843529 [Hydra vulgaris]XP_047135922.1 uncharacterized protein LOC105843529 [Hydra vulgaris]XP_047135923.1 uncharacterized protein LOC105843529 [Hydra vulgaris]
MTESILGKYQFHPHIAINLNYLGENMINEDNNKALSCFLKSLDMLKQIFGEKHFNLYTASCLNNLGTYYLNQKEYDLAISYFNESLIIRKHLYVRPEGHFEIAESLHSIGIAYLMKEDYDQALGYLKNGLKMRKCLFKESSLLTLYQKQCIASSLSGLGRTYMAKGELDDAIKFFKKCLKVQKKICVNDQPCLEIVSTLLLLCYCFIDKKEYKQAVVSCNEALEIILSGTNQNHPHIDMIKNSLIGTISFIADRHLLTPEKIVNKFFSYHLKRLNFTDYKVHFNFALSLDVTNSNTQDKEEIIEEYKLALIFLPKEEYKLKLELCQKLAILIGESSQNVELWLALTQGKSDEVKNIQNAGVIESTMFNGLTPLIFAVVEGNVELVSALISGKADLNKPDNKKNNTPLYYSLGAKKRFGVPIFELLLSNGAEVNKSMPNGDTAMHMAHYKGYKKAIHLLLQYGAMINEKNAEQKTPLHCLIEAPKISIETKLEIIREFFFKYDFTIKDRNGKTVKNYVEEDYPELLPSLFTHELLPSP